VARRSASFVPGSITAPSRTDSCTLPGTGSGTVDVAHCAFSDRPLVPSYGDTQEINHIRRMPAEHRRRFPAQRPVWADVFEFVGLQIECCYYILSRHRQIADSSRLSPLSHWCRSMVAQHPGAAHKLFPRLTLQATDTLPPCPFRICVCVWPGRTHRSDPIRTSTAMLAAESAPPPAGTCWSHRC
jgi:hypothetical protein